MWTAGAIALVLFIGGISADLLKGELATLVVPYRKYAWVVGLIALFASVGAAMWLKATEANRDAKPTLNFRWSFDSFLPEPRLPAHELILILPFNMSGCWPVLENLGPNSERIDRMSLKAHIFEEYVGRGQPTVTVALSALRWVPGDVDSNGLAWTAASPGRWICQTSFTLAEREELRLPSLDLCWDEQDIDALEEIDRLVGASDIRAEFDLTIHTARQTYSGHLDAPLRLLRQFESVEDSGVEELVASLFPRPDPQSEVALRAYEAIRRKDFDLRRRIADEVSEVFAQKAMEDISQDLREIDDQISSSPQNPKPYIERANLLAEAGVWQQALEALETAQRLGEVSSDFFFRLSRCYLSLDRPADALRAIEARLAAGPGDADAHRHHGYVLIGLERYEDAVQAFEKAISLDGSDAKSHVGLGDALRELDRNDASAASIQRAIELGDNDPRTRISRALSLASAHRDDETLIEIQAGLDAGYNDVSTLRLFSSLLGQPARRSLKAIVKKARSSITSGQPSASDSP
ncbi:hypothetical protein WI89_12300 [Burkholderia ubonensis]|nr:hypothetical protein WI89_12300 [Burkholderia ubonensis]